MSNGYLHSYGHPDLIRGFNYTTPEHRAFLVAALRAMQEKEPQARGKWGGPFIAPGIVAYCTAVLAPHVAAYRRSRRTWEGLRAFEEVEARWRKPYEPGLGPAELKKRLSRGRRAWMAA